MEVDHNARQLLDDAKQYYDKTIEEIDQEKKRLLDEFRQKADRHVAGVRAAEAARVDEVSAALKAELDETRAGVEEKYRRNALRWGDELFARCIRQEDGDA